MTVPVQIPVTASTANGATTVFPYNFKIADEEDLAVTVDGILQVSGYTVSGAGNTAGGDITFSVAPANGAKVVRYLSPILKRETDYQQFGDWMSAVVNLDLDRIWLAIQYLQQNDVRALKLPVDTTTDQVVTDTAAQRAGKVVYFDESGNMILRLPADLSLTMVTDYIATLLDDVDASEARATLGATATGSALFTAATVAAARSILGVRAEVDDIAITAGKSVIFEGATDDAFETTLTAADPTADRAIALPDMSGTVAVQARGADIASAGTINLSTATGDIADVTGTTAITAITLADGLERQVRFAGVLTLTNGASLVLPGGANITTAAGDVAVFRGYAAGVVRCVGYQKASGQAVVGASGITLGTPVASTSGTAIDFTSLPAGLKRITINFDGVSTTGSDPLCVQLGDSGGIENSGYVGCYFNSSGLTTNSMSASFVIGAPGASYSINGAITLTLLDAATNAWSFAANAGLGGATTVFFASGAKSLSATLDRVRITTTGGTNTFDAGKINIAYE